MNVSTRARWKDGDSKTRAVGRDARQPCPAIAPWHGVSTTLTVSMRLHHQSFPLAVVSRVAKGSGEVSHKRCRVKVVRRN
jgi:hypothetical protein